jgi:hypothetical protein
MSKVFRLVSHPSKIAWIFEGALGAPGAEGEASNHGVRWQENRTISSARETKTSTGLVSGLTAGVPLDPPRSGHQIALAQVSYSIRSPEIAREITSCWICSVPSKMSMIPDSSPLRLAAP